jgi:hypothetical protein
MKRNTSQGGVLGSTHNSLIQKNHRLISADGSGAMRQRTKPRLFTAVPAAQVTAGTWRFERGTPLSIRQEKKAARVSGI